MERLPAETSLVLAGQDGWATEPVYEAIERSTRNVVRLGYVDEAVVPALYRRAGAVAYPALAELRDLVRRQRAAPVQPDPVAPHPAAASDEHMDRSARGTADLECCGRAHAGDKRAEPASEDGGPAQSGGAEDTVTQGVYASMH